MFYRDALLYTFLTFITASELFDKLSERWDYIPFTSVYELEEMKSFTEECKNTVQLRILDFLTKWTSIYYYLCISGPIRVKLNSLILKLKEDNSAFEDLLIQSIETSQVQHEKLNLITQVPEPEEDISLDLGEDLIAEYFTVMDHSCFKRIRISEFLSENWKDTENRNIRAPNLCYLINRYSQIKDWVIGTVLEINLEKRKSNIKIMISLLQKLLRHHNLFAAKAFVDALTSESIRRLDKTWDVSN